MSPSCVSAFQLVEQSMRGDSGESSAQPAVGKRNRMKGNDGKEFLLCYAMGIGLEEMKTT